MPTRSPSITSPSPSEDGEIPLSDLEWDESDTSLRLGEGSFGRVVKGYMHGEEVAIKIVKRDYGRQNEDRKLKGAVRQHEREWHRLSELKFATIVQFFGVARRGDYDSGDLMIVTEFMRGGSLNESLAKLRRDGAKLTEESFLRIAWQVSNGLSYVHSRELTHGDIKPHNILLTNPVEVRQGKGWFEDGNWKAKLADFGLSMRLRRNVDDISDTADFGQGAVGTFLYMAPEAYENYQTLDARDAKAVDVYALGIVLQEMLTGRQPWVSENVRQRFTLYERVCKRKQRPQWGENVRDIRPEYIRIVNQCVAHYPRDRPTAKDLSGFFARRFHEARSRGPRPLNSTSGEAFDLEDTSKIALSVMGGEPGELAIIKHVESGLVVPESDIANSRRKTPPPWMGRQPLSTHTGTEIDSSALSLPESTHATSYHSTTDGSTAHSDTPDHTVGPSTGFEDSIAGQFCIRRIETGVIMECPSIAGLNLPSSSIKGPPPQPLLAGPRSDQKKSSTVEEMQKPYDVYIPSNRKGSGKDLGESAMGASTAPGFEDAEASVASAAADKVSLGLGVPDNAKNEDDRSSGIAGIGIRPPFGDSTKGLDSFLVAANGETRKIPAMDIDIAKESPGRSQEDLLASFFDASVRAVRRNPKEGKSGSANLTSDDALGFKWGKGAITSQQVTEEAAQVDTEETGPRREQDGRLVPLANAIAVAARKGARAGSAHSSAESRTEASAEVTPRTLVLSPGSIKEKISMFEHAGEEPAAGGLKANSMEKRRMEVKQSASTASSFVSQDHPLLKQELTKPVIASGGKRVEGPTPPVASASDSVLRKGSPNSKGHEGKAPSSPITVSGTNPASSRDSQKELPVDEKDTKPPKDPGMVMSGNAAAGIGGAQPKLEAAMSRVYRHGPPEAWIDSEFCSAIDSFLEEDWTKVTVSSSSPERTISHPSSTTAHPKSTTPSSGRAANSKSTSPLKLPPPVASKTTTTRRAPFSLYPQPTKHSPATSPLAPSHSAATPSQSSPSHSVSPPPAGQSRVEKYISILRPAVEASDGLDTVRKELLMLPTLVESESSFIDPSQSPCDCSDTIRARRVKLIEALLEVVGPGAEMLVKKQLSVQDVQIAIMSIRALLASSTMQGSGSSVAIKLVQQGTWNTLVAVIEGATNVSGTPLDIMSCALAVTAQLISCGKGRLNSHVDFRRILSYLGTILIKCLYRFYFNQNQYSWMSAAHCAVSIMTVIGERATDVSDCRQLRATSDEVYKRYNRYRNVYGEQITAIVRRLRNAEWKGYDRMGGAPYNRERRPSAP